MTTKEKQRHFRDKHPEGFAQLLKMKDTIGLAIDEDQEQIHLQKMMVLGDRYPKWLDQMFEYSLEERRLARTLKGEALSRYLKACKKRKADMKLRKPKPED